MKIQTGFEKLCHGQGAELQRGALVPLLAIKMGKKRKQRCCC